MDNARALELLEQVVAEKGDGYVYEDKQNGDCFYARYEDGMPVAPSCIVGHWAVAAGVSLGRLKFCEGTSAHSVIPTLIPGLADTDDITKALEQAQILQDKGYTWGEALVAAKEILR